MALRKYDQTPLMAFARRVVDFFSFWKTYDFWLEKVTKLKITSLGNLNPNFQNLQSEILKLWGPQYANLFEQIFSFQLFRFTSCQYHRSEDAQIDNTLSLGTGV